MDIDSASEHGPRSHVDLHCHTLASFDSTADPGAVVSAAAARGLTHLAITDHDTLDGALRARDAAPRGLTVIVGQECRTAEGDLICLFLERLVTPGRSVLDTAADVRAQGGIVGMPHPFDRARNSLLPDEKLAELASCVDYVESYNARLVGNGNRRAARYAVTHGLPGIAVSDAHSVLEVGVAYTVLQGDPGTPQGLRSALAVRFQPIPGQAPGAAQRGAPIRNLVARVRRRRFPENVS